MVIKLGYNSARKCTVTRKTVFIKDFVFCNSCHGIKTTPKGRKFLYQYFVEEDGKTQQIPHEFCSIRCIRYYLKMMSKGYCTHGLTPEMKVKANSVHRPKKLDLSKVQKQINAIDQQLKGIDISSLKTPTGKPMDRRNYVPNFVDVF